MKTILEKIKGPKFLVDKVEHLFNMRVQYKCSKTIFWGGQVEESLKRSDDTKAKLIEAAGQVFAERGFRAATVREICSCAGTPLGSMNYHFRDKLGLYTAVLEHAYRSANKKYPPDMGLGDGATPEEKLRAYVRSFLLGTLDESVPAWHMKLILQEVSDPAGALDHLVQNFIQPDQQYLAGILRDVLEEDDAAGGEESDLIFLCRLSVVGQCLCYFTGRHIVKDIHPRSFDPADIERIADHITQFSLAGIQLLSKGRPARLS
jgi:AcrR family transcriptional regulator